MPAQTTNFFRALFLAYLSLFVYGLNDNIRGPLFPEILKEFSVSDTKGALFFAFSSGMGLLGGYLGRVAIERAGSRRSLQLGTFVLMMGMGLIAASAQFWILLLSAMILGISFGFLGVVQNFLVIMGSAPQNLQQAQSGLHSMYGAASFLAPLLVSGVYQITPNWRWPFWVGFVLAGVVLLLAAVGNSKSNSKLDRLHIVEESSHEKASRASHKEQIFFSTLLAAYVVTEIIVSTRMALFLRREKNFSLEQSSIWTSLFFASLLTGRIIFIVWKPPFMIRTQMVLSLIGTLLCLLIGIFMTPWGFVLSGLTMAPFYPLSMTAAGRLFSTQVSSVMAYVAMLTSPFLATMHFGFGALTDLIGIRLALLISPFFGGLSLLMLLSYSKLFKRPFHF